jgi:hypothetical protein
VCRLTGDQELRAIIVLASKERTDQQAQLVFDRHDALGLEKTVKIDSLDCIFVVCTVIIGRECQNKWKYLSCTVPLSLFLD